MKKHSFSKLHQYRVEALNFDGRFELVGVTAGLAKAVALSDTVDQYHTRIVKCDTHRTEVSRNFTQVEQF